MRHRELVNMLLCHGRFGGVICESLSGLCLETDHFQLYFTGNFIQMATDGTVIAAFTSLDKLHHYIQGIV